MRHLWMRARRLAGPRHLPLWQGFFVFQEALMAEFKIDLDLSELQTARKQLEAASLDECSEAAA